MSYRFIVGALKELIAARRDGAQGLRICAEQVRNPQLHTLLLDHLHDCTHAVQELQTLVCVLGGTAPADSPQPRGLDSAAAQRRWAQLRAALACDEDGAILDECERGESRALEVYRNALDDPLPDLVRVVVLRQFEDVMSNHDQTRDLRNRQSMRADLATDQSAQAGQPH